MLHSSLIISHSSSGGSGISGSTGITSGLYEVTQSSHKSSGHSSQFSHSSYLPFPHITLHSLVQFIQSFQLSCQFLILYS